jgi:hypothetical protein
MCWSAEVSLNTFLFSFSVFIFAYAFGFEPKLLFLYFWFIVMQLVEYFLWKNLYDDYWNRIFSILAFSILAIHPFAFTLIVSNPVLRGWFMGLYIIYLGFLIYTHFSKMGEIDYSVSVAENGHLSWNWVTTYEVFYYLYIFFFIVLIIEKEYIAFIVIFIAHFYSFFTYYQYHTFSSLWCWSANIVGVFIVLRVLYDWSKKHEKRR